MSLNLTISLSGNPDSLIRDPFNEFQAREKEILEELKKLNLDHGKPTNSGANPETRRANDGRLQTNRDSRDIQ
jgi:hypothetical protein